MKIRVLVSSCLALVVGVSTAVWGVQPGKNPPLPNLDVRQAQKPTPLAAKAAPSAAEMALQARVPGAQVSRHNITATPRWIAAQRGYLTGPQGLGSGLSPQYLQAFSVDDPNRVVKAFVNENSAVFGHDSSVLDLAKTTRDSVSAKSGLRTVAWQQLVDDIEVYEGVFTANLSRQAELVTVGDSFVKSAANAAAKGSPNSKAMVQKMPISVERAIALAGANAGVAVEETGVEVAEAAVGADKKQINKANHLLGPVYSQLVWLPMNEDTLRLCWRIILSPEGGQHTYQTLVDGETGEVLVRINRTFDATAVSFNVYTSDSPSPFTPGHTNLSTIQPPETNRVLVTYSKGALDTNASPAGWIPDGASTTMGNNAQVFLDRDNNQQADVPPPVGGPTRTFDFPLDLTKDPLTYASASTVQLFYRVNWYHDRLYEYGFTETAGNFQFDNFGRGGLDGDFVRGLVQCGADSGLSDNATFTTLPDGIPGVCRMFIWTGPRPSRDGSLDQEIVVHELTHGLSNRLLGGGIGISEWQPRGMGEGWSDFYASMLLSQNTDDPDGNYPSGGYAAYLLGGLNFQENYYFGIRRYPYSTNQLVNPLTFKDIDPTQADPHMGIPSAPWLYGAPAEEVHNMGEVWCVALFDVWMNLVSKMGHADATDLMLQLTTDGLKLAPANATYLEARDAILLAEDLITAGENYAEVWKGFAGRGYGFSASCPTADTTVGVVEAYDLPPGIITSRPDGVMEFRMSPPNLGALIPGETNRLAVQVTDASGVSDATIVTTISSGTAPVFKNDGVPPDFRAGDSTYTANYVMPPGVPSVTLTMVVTATNKLTATNIVTYLAVPAPANDNLNKATKVPLGGAVYYTSNKRATTEPDEPAHAGVVTSDRSLWYDYTSVTNTTLVLDSGGSDFTAVLAVYTNNTMATLKPVAAAVGNSQRKGPFLYFTANGGTTYHIAIAGKNSENYGTVRLKVAPGIFADTNAPSVAVTAPVSGTSTNSPTLVVFQNKVQFSGSAVDSDPFASGIREVSLSISAASNPGAETITQGVFDPSVEGPLSTNWNALVGLQAGLNVVRVWTTDFAGNRSPIVVVEVNYRYIDPPNDFLATATAITNASGTKQFFNASATKETGEPNHANNAGGKSVWWSFAAPKDGVLSLNTRGSSFDTLLAVYTGVNVAALTPVGSNDDDPSTNSGVSALTVAVQANQVYQIAVDGYGGAYGSGNLNYSFVAGAIVQLTMNAGAGGVATPGSGGFASNTVVTLTAIPALEYQFDRWDGSLSTIQNPLNVTLRSNMTFTALFKLANYTDNFESGGLSEIPWTTSGNLPWSVPATGAPTNVASGSFAARSGAITHNQSSSLLLTADFNAGNGSFAYKTSCEANWDNLEFLVDGVLIQQWSGEQGWARFAFPVTAGTHTLEWRYAKDASGSAGQDAAFIDNVLVPLVIPKNGTTPALLSLSRQTDGNYLLSLTGQPNQTYQVQLSTNLVNWQTFSAGIAYGGFLQVLDSTSANKPGRYYRAVVP